MGLLTSDQLAAIQGGARVRQVWTLLVPTSSDRTAFTETVIHDDDWSGDKCVIDAGKRRVSGYNVSLMEPGEMRTGDYSFEVANINGQFYQAGAGTLFVNGAYLAKPQECRVRHQLYVDVGHNGEPHPDAPSLTVWSRWDEIEAVRYEGRIVDVRYSDTGGATGAKPGTAVIETENADVSTVLLYRWQETDGEDVDTGIDFYGETP